MDYKKIGLKVIEKLNNNGFEAYFVGGFVRDYLMNIDSTDIDITTNASPEDIIRLFDNVNNDGISYYSLKVNEDNHIFEITTFRHELSYDDYRHPIVEIAKTLDDDLKRRDFTINALAMDKDDNIIDKFNGLNDLKNKIIRVIGDGNVRFKEDALRILRACYFKAKTGFEIEQKTMTSMINNAHFLTELSNESIKRELTKLFNQENKFLGMDALINSKSAYYLGFEKTLSYVLNNNLNLSLDDVLIISASIENSKIELTKNQNKEAEFIKENIYRIDVQDNFQLYKIGKKRLELLAHSLNTLGNNIDLNDLLNKYDLLSIKSFKDVLISPLEIKEEFDVDGAKLGLIIEEIEKNILNNNISNNKDIIKSFIKKIV